MPPMFREDVSDEKAAADQVNPQTPAKYGAESLYSLLRRFRPLSVLAIAAAVILLPIGTWAQSGGSTLLPGFSLSNTHVNESVDIDSQNAMLLHAAWHFKTHELVSHAPLVVDGVVYFADWGGNVYAVSTANGRLIWRRHLEKPNEKWAWHGFAGTGTLVNGLLIEASVEGKAFALNAKTGRLVWQTQYTTQPYTGNLSTLLAYNGVVYIGVQSVDEPLAGANPSFVPKARGGVVALNAATGKKVWEFFTVPPGATGAAVWSSFAVNPALNALFFTTGNNYTTPATSMSDSIISVNASTGHLNWSTQLTGGDIWTPPNPMGPDWDFGAGAQLFSAMVNGVQTPLVGAAQKSGEYVVLNQTNGTMVWHAHVGIGGVGGGMRGEASIVPNMILAWSNNNWNDVLKLNPLSYPINVKALDPATGSVIWADNDVQPAMGTSAGFLAKDVYFVGSLDGTINAYRSGDGALLWTGHVPSSVSSSLNVSGNTLLVGIGVPSAFNGQPTPAGLYAFSIQR